MWFSVFLLFGCFLFFMFVFLFVFRKPVWNLHAQAVFFHSPHAGVSLPCLPWLGEVTAFLDYLDYLWEQNI